MADAATILTEVQLEAQKAIASWGQFGKAGVQELRSIGKAANDTNQQLMSNSGAAGMAKRFKGALSDMGASIRAFGKEAKSMGQNLSLNVGLPLTLLGRAAVKAFREQEVALAQLDAALASTGGTVGVSREEMIKFAEDTQKSFAFADEEVNNMQTTLLKFQNVQGDVFRRAEQVALDLATRMGTDLPSAAQTLGRALDDPARGMMLLRRAGILLTDQQEATIKTLDATGQSAKAQSMLLDLLTEKVGGAAAAFAKTDAGKFAIAMNLVGDSMEKIGGIIAPVITKLAEGLNILVTGFTSLPEPLQEAIVFVGMFAAAIGPILFVIGSLIESFTLFSAFLLGPWGAVILGVILAIGLLIEAFGGWQRLLSNVLFGVAAVAQGLGELWDIMRFVANGFSNEGIVPSDWGVPIAKAAIEMSKLADEADKAKKETAEATAKQQGLTTATHKTVAEMNTAAKTMDDIAGKDVQKPIADAHTESTSWWTTLKGILVTLGLISDEKTKAAPVGGAGKARGGLIRGRGTSTSDSIPAWLSHREYVQKAAAVRKYGVGFMNAVNSLRYPSSLAQGFAGGGLVGGAARPMLRSSGSAAPTSNAGRPLTLVIDGQSFNGLRVPSDTAADMMAFAQERKVRSAGKKPFWYS